MITKYVVRIITRQTKFLFILSRTKTPFRAHRFARFSCAPETPIGSRIQQTSPRMLLCEFSGTVAEPVFLICKGTCACGKARAASYVGNDDLVMGSTQPKASPPWSRIVFA